MEPKKSVAAYCRVSTMEQKRRGYGIDVQIRDVTLFAERQELFIRRFYRDEAESGIAEDRKELKKLLQDCRAGRVGTVIIPSLDRLSRDVRLAENLFHEFEKRGVQVLIADMPTYNGKDRKDVLIRQIREAIAEENRKDIIERLWKGRQERVRRGLAPGGNVPYGYRRNGAGLIRHEEEAAVVRRIFELAACSKTKEATAKILEAEGLMRRNGKPWTRRQVSAVLAHAPLYRDGIIRYGEVEARRPELALLGSTTNERS
ncbi:MAG: recombinase family protein [Vicinamibacteria bacterium]